MNDTVDFEIITETTGSGKVIMNGEDITPFVRSIQVVAASQELTIVGVEFIKAKVVLTGPAFLQPLVAGTGTSAGQAVRALDWEKLKGEALDALSYEEDPMDALLNKVAEKLDGTEAGQGS
jgi:phosphotransferase system IIA component